jgi:hypothetical protein
VHDSDEDLLLKGWVGRTLDPIDVYLPSAHSILAWQMQLTSSEKHRVRILGKEPTGILVG